RSRRRPPAHAQAAPPSRRRWELVTERERAAAMVGRRAGFVSRISAAAVDITIVLAAYVLLLVGIGFVHYLATDDKFEVAHPPTWFNGAAVVVLIVVALALAWSGSGRTPGDSLMGLRVVTASGERVGFARAVMRGLVLVVLPVLSMGWILVSRKNAGLHDLVCLT